MRPTDAEIAWAAGLFEGEGCVTSRITGNDRAVIRFQIGSTDLDVLERFHEIVGCGAISGPDIRRTGALGTKPIYRWQAAAKADVARLTDWFLPYMGSRRTNAIERAWHRFANQQEAVLH